MRARDQFDGHYSNVQGVMEDHFSLGLIAAIACWIEQLPAGNSPVLLGIDGCSCAGKSTLAGQLASTIGPRCSVLTLDDLAIPMSRQRRVQYSQDRGPAHLRLNELENQFLRPLRQGMQAQFRPLDWASDQIGPPVPFPATEIVLIEGVFSGCGRLRSWLKGLIWVHGNASSRLQRIAARDGSKLLSFWREVWLPTELEYNNQEMPWTSADIVVAGADLSLSSVGAQISALRPPRPVDRASNKRNDW